MPRLALFVLILAACAPTIPAAYRPTAPAASREQLRARATRIVSLHGTVTDVKSHGFVLRARDGRVDVTLSSRTVLRGHLHDGDYAQVVGRGMRPDRARYVAIWRSPPPLQTVSGRIEASTKLGFSLDLAGSSSATIVVLSSSTKTPSLTVGEDVTVNGFGSVARGIVATRVSVDTASASPSPTPNATPAPTTTPVATATPKPTPTPRPTPTPTAAPTPKGIALSPGEIVGEDNLFTPPDADTSTGGQSQTVDGIPCEPTMFNNYHVHVYVGLYVAGKQVAIPDQIGMYQPGPISNGYTNTATCFYYIHTHDASGMVHLEAPQNAAVSTSLFTLQNVFDIWGMTVGPNNFGPFTGKVRIFIGQAKLGTTIVKPSSYSEYFGDPNAIALYSHQAIWFEVGPPYNVPPYIPEIVFYNEY
jgi:hypothetical protein